MALIEPVIKKFSLKDHLFNKQSVSKLAYGIQAVHKNFMHEIFIQTCLKEFPNLELKARINSLAHALQKFLPQDYEKAIAILLASLPPPNNPHLSDNDFGDFIYSSYSHFVAMFGCKKPYLKLSLNALYEITQRFSAEDALRYFINQFPDETIQQLMIWTKDKHYHVRRLCSESTRPKLPWSQLITIPIETALPILHQLFSDNTRFVTRSVANHLNDISKIKPEICIKILKQWRLSGQQNKKEMDYITQHALRSLVKQGHQDALALLGYEPTQSITITQFQTTKIVKLNSSLEFSFTISGPIKTRLLIDYIIHFRNKKGQLKSQKTYKLTKLQLNQQPISIKKTHKLSANMTTRQLYQGQHMLELQINGIKYAKRSFLLK